MIPLSLARVALPLSFFFLALEPQAQLRARKLSPELLRSPFADVEADPRFSPDGTRIVYRASNGAQVELFSADGLSPPVRLSTPLLSVSAFQVDPTGQRVVYRVGEKLYAVPIAGGSPVQLTALPAGRSLTSFQVTPDGAHVVYRADAVTLERFLLLTVPIAGGASVVVNGPLAAAGDVGEGYLVSPDSSRVVYRADQDVDERHELYSARVGVAASSIKLNDPLAPDRDVEGGFRLTGDGARVVYRADVMVDGQVQLFSAPIAAAGASVLLASPFHSGGDVLPGLEVSLDGARVVFRSPRISGATEVLSVPVDGSALPVTLNLPLSGGNDVTHAAVSPDSTRVVYRGEQNTTGVFELYTAPIDGSAPAVPLNGALATDVDVLASFEFAPAGGRVVFQTASSGAESARLYSALVDGSAPALELDSGLWTFGPMPAIGPDGARVFYRKSVLGGVALLSARLDGSAAPIVLGGGLRALASWTVRADSAFVAYAADQDVLNAIELFLAPAGVPYASLQINLDSTATTTVGNVHSMRVTRSHAVYAALQDDPNASGLYSVPLSGGPSRRLDASIPVLPEGKLAIGAGERVVFQGGRRFGDRVVADGLHSVPLSGRSAPIPLNAPLVSGGSVVDYALSADGAQVVFRADQDQDEVFELYRSAIGVAASPVKLNSALVPGGDVLAGYALAAGGRVVYVADQAADEVFELFSADGSGPPLALSGTLAPGGDVQADPRLSPDGTTAFFRADKTWDGIVELYAVPVDGSAAPVGLSGTSVQGGNVEDFLVTADGARVVFRCDRVVDELFELYTVPSDGSHVPVLLSKGLLADRDVTPGFALDPTSTYAVYRADGGIMDERFKLYSVRVDGSAPQVRIDTTSYSVKPLHEGSAVTPGFQITPDGTRVLFLQDVELYSVLIGGGGLLKLNAPLSTSSYPGIEGFLIDPTGEHVVYLGDREGLVQLKVFHVPIDRRREPIELTPPDGERVRDDLVFTSGGEAVVFRCALEYLSYHGLFAAQLERAALPALPP